MKSGLLAATLSATVMATVCAPLDFQNISISSVTADFSVYNQVGASWCFLDPDSSRINKRLLIITNILLISILLPLLLLLINIITSDPEHPFVFGLVLFLGTWLSMMISTVNGAGTPVLVMMMRVMKVVMGT